MIEVRLMPERASASGVGGRPHHLDDMTRGDELVRRWGVGVGVEVGRERGEIQKGLHDLVWVDLGEEEAGLDASGVELALALVLVPDRGRTPWDLSSGAERVSGPAA